MNVILVLYFRNQLRGVLEIFKAKESLLNIPDVSNSEPYQKKEEKGTRFSLDR